MKYVVLHNIDGEPYSCYVYQSKKKAISQFNFIIDNIEEEIIDSFTSADDSNRYVAYGAGDEIRLIQSDN